MRKLILSWTLLFLFLTPSPIYASNGFKPSSQLYFLETWGESIRLFFTIPTRQKLNYLVKLTDKRVNEIANEPSTAAAKRYENLFQKMNKIMNKAQNKQQALNQIKKTCLNQQQVLSQVYQQVPAEAQVAIIIAQENSAKHVVNTIEVIEGVQSAQEYAARVDQIQQVEKIESMQKLTPAPMETSPNSMPSQAVPKELKQTNPPKQGQPLKSLNPPMENSGSAGETQVEPVAPVQMNQPAKQN